MACRDVGLLAQDFVGVNDKGAFLVLADERASGSAAVRYLRG
jgi:hypothetical protein